MKRYIKSSTAYTQYEAIAIENFGRSNPGTGNSYISPDGTFINLYPKLDTHEDLCWWLEDNFDCKLEYEDEEYFIREFGWVRLRTDPHMMIIELPSSSPTRNQWYSLEDWLQFCEGKYPRGTTLYLNVCDGRDTDVEYKFGTEYFTEDIIKICKRYYSSGKLYANTIISKIHWRLA